MCMLDEFSRIANSRAMSNHILIFGLGYCASYLAKNLRNAGWRVTAVRRVASDGIIAFDDMPAINAVMESATHILSSVPPERAGGDPVLQKYGAALINAPARWTGYLSSTGVYGDAGGAWVDENTAVNGRRAARNAADLAWQELHGDVTIFRLPGIYGPGRCALDRVADGNAHRIDLPEQIFSRVHVADIVLGIIASFGGPAGIYNLADDYPCSQNAVIEYASALLGIAPPPVRTIDEAGLSPMARDFYAENRRVSNRKAKRLLGWQPLYPNYIQGLRSIYAEQTGKSG